MNQHDKARADRVIQVYKDSNLNQKKFSELIGVSQQLISAIINYTKRPNESILFGIIDNIDTVDPLWLITGKRIESLVKEQNNVPLNSNEQSPIEFYLNDVVKERIDRLADKILRKRLSELILEKISSIEEMVGELNDKAPKK
ncbi:MAG: hypothetical protein CMB99_14410 [Flavobacteriaceae bacterium]|nr:hypothetical protein [Flavobacteriaceae bacterium]|tara:strand:- start:177487 stop:177915 length:429 start_codon:yes stop_codon:yes gene_type:complete